jgi:hypothetical protein
VQAFVCAHEEIAPPITEGTGKRLHGMFTGYERDITKYILEKAMSFYTQGHRKKRPSALFLAGCIALWLAVDAQQFWITTGRLRGANPNPHPTPDPGPQ